MTGKVLELHNVLVPDQLATRITERWVQWDTLRQNKKNDWEEIIRYVYQIDTTQTTNNQLPWKNKTTIPKLCQIYDNLIVNYMATMFPQRKWFIWEAMEKNANSVDKRDAITNYMTWVCDQPGFKHEIEKCLADYIQRGNPFATVEWLDERIQQPDKTQVGYVGPSVRRINPLEIVFNPTAENFHSSPKIVRSIISLGEVRQYLNRIAGDDRQEEMEALYTYLKNIRFHARTFQGDWAQYDHLYQMDGFSSYRAYLLSEFVEILTFYGDYYDYINDVYETNRVITVIDRHKLIANKPNPSYFGYPPIFHVPWRKKPDNLWGMGPLDNLVGMQYRLDHVENMRADVVDLTTYPVQMVTGMVEDYVWQPGEKIFTQDEGKVELISPQTNVLQANFELQQLQQTMEEMAGAPKEAMGFRTPGEKTKYEVQRLENAASRLFQNKIKQFEEQFLEPLMNAMLELARRNMQSVTTIRVMDSDFNMATFQEITPEDITGIGRIKPIAARHFAEQAELVQNLTNLTGSGMWPVVQPHFSGIKLARIMAKIFNLEDYDVFTPWVALSEQADAQKFQQALQENVQSQTMTPSGLGHDFDQSALAGGGKPPMGKPTPFDLKRQPPANAEPGGLLGTQ